MNPKIEKINGNIERTEKKVADGQARLRELKQQKIILENAQILTMVRDMGVDYNGLKTFVQMFKYQKTEQGGAIPDLPNAEDGEKSNNDKEEKIED